MGNHIFQTRWSVAIHMSMSLSISRILAMSSSGGSDKTPLNPYSAQYLHSSGPGTFMTSPENV